MKTHTEIGGRILSGSNFPLLQVARDIALYHHERWDGEGYNPGIGGELIPLVGRIVAVADVFDSLTHERPYKAAQSQEEALEIILSEAGHHLDPRVVEAFQEVVRAGRLRELRWAKAEAGPVDGVPNDVVRARLELVSGG
jgi:putative two-component system response regulator